MYVKVNRFVLISTVEIGIKLMTGKMGFYIMAGPSIFIVESRRYSVIIPKQDALTHLDVKVIVNAINYLHIK